MKNLVVFLMVFVVLVFAVPAMAQRGVSSNSSFNGLFGSQRGDRGSADSAVLSQDQTAEKASLARQEVSRVLGDKGFKVTRQNVEGTLTVEIKFFLRDRLRCPNYDGYRRQCYSDPESVVYVTLSQGDLEMAVGVGENRNFRKAVESAATSAADKIKEEERKGKLVYFPK